jgi:hypothetical protein
MTCEGGKGGLLQFSGIVWFLFLGRWLLVIDSWFADLTTATDNRWGDRPVARTKQNVVIGSWLLYLGYWLTNTIQEGR